jgi:hypothetical protein
MRANPSAIWLRAEFATQRKRIALVSWFMIHVSYDAHAALSLTLLPAGERSARSWRFASSTTVEPHRPMAEQAAGDWLRLAAVVAAMTAALLLTLGAMLGAARLSRILGERGGHVIGRVLGVVLAALAAQIALDGIRESFA